MMRFNLPNFRGQRALVLHRADKNSATLVRQLEGLGLEVRAEWPVDNLSPVGVDVIFFDADLGYDGLFSWPPGNPPIPLIAMMGSEAPGRIEWTLAHSPSAYLVKPIGSTGVFSALAIAFHTFETQRQLNHTIDSLTKRARARPIVFKALLIVMERFGIGDSEAYRLLRTESMDQRVSIEELSQLITSNASNALDHLEGMYRRSLRKANRL